jgi:hypothetical protein
MTRPGERPSWWSTTATRAALHVIPPGPARVRWQHELVSELYGLSSREQARHTLGVITRVPALRAAVTDRERIIEEDVMRKPVRCRLSFHQYRVASTEDGARFLRCRRCGREDTSLDPGHWAGSLGGGPS